MRRREGEGKGGGESEKEGDGGRERLESLYPCRPKESKDIISRTERTGHVTSLTWDLESVAIIIKGCFAVCFGLFKPSSLLS